MLLRPIRLILYLILTTSFAIRAVAQDVRSLHDSRAVVVADSLTRKPLSFASAVFRDTRKGVIADVDGRLLLKAPFPDQVLTISRIGYQSKKIRPSDLPDTVLLSPAAAALESMHFFASNTPQFAPKSPHNAPKTQSLTGCF